MTAHPSARSTLLAALLAVCLIAPGRSRAAEVTHTATAFEIDNPFDFEPSAAFERIQRRGTITRERHQPDDYGAGHVADVLELRYTEVTQQLPIRAAFGLYQDLELHVGISMVFSDVKSFGYPGLDKNGKPVTSSANSTITNNCIDSRGNLTASTCKGDSFSGAVPIFDVPVGAWRAGWTSPNVGLTWAIFTDVKDDTKPTWTVSADYYVPAFDMVDPTAPTSESKPGGFGDKVHRFAFATAVSKKLGPVDPYVRLAYTLPKPVGAPSYSNCDNKATLGYGPDNCGVGPWTRAETGIKPPHVGQFLFGSEFYFYDDPGKHQRIGIDIQFLGQYTSEGRYYNEMSDILGKLLYTEDYLTVGGKIGLYARMAEFAQLRLTASLYHDTEHWLTNEQVGRDLDNSCKGIAGQKCVDLGNATHEINPNFDFRYDLPGRRFRISEVNVFSLMATGMVTF